MVVLDEMREARQNYRANRRAWDLCSRGRVSPRRLGLSKVVDVVSNSNDALGTTVGSKSNGKYSAAALTAFGENLSVDSPTPTQNSNFFTGKPMVEGLGYAFWMRNYRAGLAKWQTADPLGYPDGWNQLAYCGNSVVASLDYLGGVSVNGCVIPSNDLPIVKGINIQGVGFSLAVKWTCNHDFDAPSIRGHVSVAEGCSQKCSVYADDYCDMYLWFSYQVLSDTFTLLEDISTSWEKVFELKVVVKVEAYDVFEYGDWYDEVKVYTTVLTFQSTHSIAREWFE